MAPPGYTFVRELGSGASGTVYLALRAGSERAVSVKVWRDTRRLDRAARAWKELDLLGEFNLPVVPRVLDYGTCDGTLYVTTDYIDGVDPVAFARNHTFNHKERALLLADLCDAVQVLHEHGIIHRDIKPANILVSAGANGRQVFILDMGLALLARRSQDGMTLEGQPVGTLGFMAPEQARGERAKVSVRSDVYSLGAIGYELLCGQTPHATEGGASETLLRIATSPARGAAALSPDLPAPLAAVLEKSVRVEPAERYASAADFAADLRRWSKGERVLATPPRRWQKVMEWAGRHPKMATGVVCGVMLLTTAVGVYGVTRWTLRKPYKLLRITGQNQNHLLALRLVSRSGNTLHEWPHDRPGMLWDAAMTDRPNELGGGTVALIAFDHCERPGVFAFDADNPAGPPVWTSGFDSRDFTPPPGVPEGFVPNFGAVSLTLADVFPDSPGEEVIVLHNHRPLGQSVLRIYDLAGKVLFEAWHHGHLKQVRWLSGDEVLVVHGENDEATWKQRGHPECEHPWPLVVFGLKPVLGERHGWIATPGNATAYSPEWYKCILPADACERLQGEDYIALGDLGNKQLDAGRHFTVGVPPFTLYFNSRGEEVDRQEWITTTQATDARLGTRLRTEEVTLGDLPGVIEEK